MMEKFHIKCTISIFLHDPWLCLKAHNPSSNDYHEESLFKEKSTQTALLIFTVLFTQLVLTDAY